MTLNKYCVNQGDKMYQRAVQRESRTWAKKFNLRKKGLSKFKPDDADLEYRTLLFSEDNPALVRYNNAVLGVESDDVHYWIDYLKERIGGFEHGLSVGSGMGEVEKLFLDKGLVRRWTTADLVDTEEYLKDEARVEHIVTDLNFIDLTGQKFDLILCKAILHHLVNLEYVLFELNRALDENGVLVVRDHVVESKRQYHDQKLDHINTKLTKRFGKRLEDIHMSSPVSNHNKPFECVRSGDIIDIIDHYFGGTKIIEHRWNGITATVLSQLRRQYRNVLDSDTVQEIIDYSIQLDRDCDDESIVPGTIFGAYRKAGMSDQIPAREWGRQEKDFYISIKNNQPLRKKIKDNKVYRFFQNIKYHARF